jgi:Uncharacterised nucleotidyltransferase
VVRQDSLLSIVKETSTVWKAGDSAAAWSREIELLRCCTRAAFGADETASIGELISSEIDWDSLIRNAQAHGVLPLLSRAKLPQGIVPPTVAARLEALFQTNARRSLFLTQELLHILRVLEQNGISAIPLKGPSLAVLAYGDLALRQYLDLDILLQHRDVEKAIEALTNDRYQLKLPLTPEQLQYELRSEHQHHLELSGGNGHVLIELHWQFMPARFFFSPNLDPVWNRQVQRSLAGATVNSLSTEDLVIFLCVHGWKHHWSQLSWIADLAGLVRNTTIDWPLLLRFAQNTDSKRRVLLGFGLAQYLLRAPLPAIVEREILADRALDKLILRAERTLVSRKLPEPARFGPYKHALAVSDGSSHSARILYTFVRKLARLNEEDFAWVALPRPLFFLYYVLHPVRLVVQWVSRVLGLDKRPDH